MIHESSADATEAFAMRIIPKGQGGFDHVKEVVEDAAFLIAQEALRRI
jgi:hypothetical protein